MRKCKCRCGETDPSKFSPTRSTDCTKCCSTARNKATNENKEWAIKYMGGQCFVCGYNDSHWALQFHHINPEDKDEGAKNMMRWSRIRLKKELLKCRMLCANCHAEIHEIIGKLKQEVGQSGSLLGLDPRCRRFESSLPDHLQSRLTELGNVPDC